jgi:hypothetical protein
MTDLRAYMGILTAHPSILLKRGADQGALRANLKCIFLQLQWVGYGGERV